MFHFNSSASWFWMFGPRHYLIPQLPSTSPKSKDQPLFALSLSLSMRTPHCKIPPFPPSTYLSPFTLVHRSETAAGNSAQSCSVSTLLKGPQVELWTFTCSHTLWRSCCIMGNVVKFWVCVYSACLLYVAVWTAAVPLEILNGRRLNWVCLFFTAPFLYLFIDLVRRCIALEKCFWKRKMFFTLKVSYSLTLARGMGTCDVVWFVRKTQKMKNTKMNSRMHTLFVIAVALYIRKGKYNFVKSRDKVPDAVLRCV